MSLPEAQQEVAYHHKPEYLHLREVQSRFRTPAQHHPPPPLFQTGNPMYQYQPGFTQYQLHPYPVYPQAVHNQAFPHDYHQQRTSTDNNNVITGGGNIDYPRIADWLRYLQLHPVRSQDGISFTDLTEKFSKEGFIRINQLTPDFVGAENLANWLGIGKGTTVMLIQYAQEDLDAIRKGNLQIPKY
jgi:hypothetical protein